MTPRRSAGLVIAALLTLAFPALAATGPGQTGHYVGKSHETSPRAVSFAFTDGAVHGFSFPAGPAEWPRAIVNSAGEFTAIVGHWRLSGHFSSHTSAVGLLVRYDTSGDRRGAHRIAWYADWHHSG